jgi:carbonic anhydrase/acetyltransferase-like protein (isoleucine patch superfamily)
MSKRPDWPLVLPYDGVMPTLAGPVQQAGTGSAVLGRVTLGAQACLLPYATLRGDGHVVQVGNGFFLGEHSTVHIAHGLYGTTIGHGVSVGGDAVVHACTVGDDCVIQREVAVLDGATIGPGCVVAAGAVVFPRSVLPAGQWCEGVPAVAVRPVAAGELQAEHQRVRAAAGARLRAGEHLHTNSMQVAADPACYVAATVVGAGRVQMGAGSSLWFGCVVDAAGPGPGQVQRLDPGLGLILAPGCNVQDNSVLRSSTRAVSVGAQTTIGHNVLLHDCSVGAQVLVGMGSSLAPGTVVHDQVLIAGGSSTTPGQVLEGGWLWGGRPARALSRLDERKLGIIQRSAAIYCDYAQGFASSQAAASRLAESN